MRRHLIAKKSPVTKFVIHLSRNVSTERRRTIWLLNSRQTLHHVINGEEGAVLTTTSDKCVVVPMVFALLEAQVQDGRRLD